MTPNGKYPARGISVNSDPSALANWGANRIKSMPDGLEVIHTPTQANPQHCDIIPKDRSISQEEFQKLLDQIVIE